MFDSSTPENSGLLICYSQSVDTYCIVKTVQCGFSTILLIWTVFEGYKQLSQIRQTRYNYIILIAITLTLLCNIFFCLWNNVFTLYSLQTFFNNIYFLMIVGYVIVQYLQKNIVAYQKYRVVYIVSILINGLLFFLMFIDSLIQVSSLSCEQVWYLVVNGECIFLSLILILILVINQREQMKKLALLEQTSLNIKLSNPLRGLWIWIGINVAAQIMNLVESSLFLNTSKSNLCQILDNHNWNEILMLIFVFLTMYSQFIATLVYLGYLRRRFLKSNSENIDAKYEKIQFQIQYEENKKNSFTLSL